MTRRTNQNQTNLLVATYNIKSMNKDDKLYELEKEPKQIKWNVLGISEIRRRGEQCIQLNSGNMLYYRGAIQDKDDNIPRSGIYGKQKNSEKCNGIQGDIKKSRIQ
ncbi:hypothetical protein ILUMI_24718 [Ignelater luminosus]|uniref:Uncharacterized protein n=1 Tax=Ignelater luminosus TaxID=2038154 RepID=A0A8K0C9X3_IGNLU|nr:hypothetical protein ILUMI_24718 [Ignelater luminosus]